MLMNFKIPKLTVDGLIIKDKKILLIKRKNQPFQGKWALPGGFVDYGESLEESAVREAKEETSLDVDLKTQFHTYSAPDRDPRQHTISTVYIAEASGQPKAQDDAKDVRIFKNKLPKLVFDHKKILNDYFKHERRN